MAKTDNFAIRNSAIEDRAQAIAEDMSIDIQEAFFWLAASTIFDIPVDEIDPVDIIDGNQDKQIDFIRINDDEDRGVAEIHILQAKKETGFKSNTAIQIKNGLNWIFTAPKTEYERLKNSALVQKIREIRDLRVNYGASNLSVFVYYATMADSSVLPEEYLQERGSLIAEFSSAGFGEFDYCEIGVHELFSMQSQADKASHKINLDLNVVYDVNRPSVVEFSAGKTKAILCTITGSELARITKSEPRDAIFDLNVRPYYGVRGRVNQDIWSTAVSAEQAGSFWFLNNGITVTCDSYDFSRDPDNPIVKIKNAQIVNGCQTSVTIRSAQEKGVLDPQVKILARIYASDSPAFIEKITLTTNNQNKITDRDLKANDDVQRDIEQLMLAYGYFYERKNKQHKNLKGDKKKKIIPNDKCAQAYLAIVRAKPSNARGYLGAIWSNHYDEIFKNATVEDLIACYKIYKFCQMMAKECQKDLISDQDLKDTKVYGMFHIARAIGWRLVGEKWGATNKVKISRLINPADAAVAEIHSVYEWASKLVHSLRAAEPSQSKRPALYFKSQAVQKALAQELHNARAPNS